MELVLFYAYKYLTLASLAVILITCVAWVDDIGPSLDSPRWRARRVAILGTTVGCFGVILQVAIGAIAPSLSLTLLSVGIGVGMAAHVENGWWNFVWRGCARREPRPRTASGPTLPRAH